MNWPSITILMPSLNQGHYIERAILSIIRQQYQGRIQLIVADGGSKDETVDILKRYPQITWWSKPDKGIIDALDQALRIADGEFLAACPTSDFYLPNAFAKTVPLLVKNPELAFVSGGVVYLAEDDRRFSLSRLFHTRVSNPLDHLTCKVSVYLPGALVRKTCFDAIGGFKDEYAICCDAALLYEMLHYYDGMVIPEYLTVFQQHADQITRSNAQLYIDSFTKLVENYETCGDFPRSYRLDEDKKRDLYLQWEMYFNNHNGGTKGRKQALKLACSILEESSQHSAEVIEFAKSVQYSSVLPKKRCRDLARELIKRLLAAVALDYWVRYSILRRGSIEGQIASSLNWWLPERH
jgi:glycosyltransferase involved in cell wall biosynthesis